MFWANEIGAKMQMVCFNDNWLDDTIKPFPEYFQSKYAYIGAFPDHNVSSNE